MPFTCRERLHSHAQKQPNPEQIRGKVERFSTTVLKTALYGHLKSAYLQSVAGDGMLAKLCYCPRA
jgi:hypothetical protein